MVTFRWILTGRDGAMGRRRYERHGPLQRGHGDEGDGMANWPNLGQSAGQSHVLMDKRFECFEGGWPGWPTFFEMWLTIPFRSSGTDLGSRHPEREQGPSTRSGGAGGPPKGGGRRQPFVFSW